jgi:HAD superfamily hydrolase (TIGR01549 family)
MRRTSSSWPYHAGMPLVPVFDLDGTLLDSDKALVAPFVALGIDEEQVTFGHVLADECARLGIEVEAYLEHYDTDMAAPFEGTIELIESLDRWAVCSNKIGDYGRAELDRLRWKPEISRFADDFQGPKSLPPVLRELELGAGDIVFVGDTAHDRACAIEVGARFVLAGWNPRAVAAEGDIVLANPLELLDLIS